MIMRRPLYFNIRFGLLILSICMMPASEWLAARLRGNPDLHFLSCISNASLSWRQYSTLSPAEARTEILPVVIQHFA